MNNLQLFSLPVTGPGPGREPTILAGLPLPHGWEEWWADPRGAKEAMALAAPRWHHGN